MSLSRRCELCEAASITTRYYEDEECWIADCLICRVPMVVWRVHEPTVPEEVRDRLIGCLTSVAESFFEGCAWHYDDHMRNIPDHYHGHARRR
jgi:hypothetical protein